MRNNSLKVYTTIVCFIISIASVLSQPIPDIFSPIFSHLSGRYNSDIQVQLTTRTPNADMFFALDGTDPDSSSQEYVNSISIAGDETFITIKAITISEDTLTSLISSATYIIDYSFNPNASYLTNLSWEEYNVFIQGDWFGYTSNPWTNNYCVNLSILPNENYIDQTTTGCGSFPYDDIFQPVFYYGISNPSPLKIIELYDLLPSGYANGFVDIVFQAGNTNRDELRYIKFIDNRNLYLEMWHHNKYGPLEYYLTKDSPLITSSKNIYEDQKTSVFPNPASDFLIIKNLNSTVQLVNQLGQSYQLEKKEKISVNHLPRGFYIIYFTNNEGTSIKQKLILN